MNSAMNSGISLEKKILFIQSSVDQKFRLILNTAWGSKNPNHRQEIRNFLAQHFSRHFSREQLAQLSDLSRPPLASDVFVSISHSCFLGGFALSQYEIGFDTEETHRISQNLLRRVSTADELQNCPMIESIWVGKEAGFKALSRTDKSLVIADLHCCDWESYFENQIFGFRMKCKKTLAFNLNKGFIFSEGPCLYGLYFK